MQQVFKYYLTNQYLFYTGFTPNHSLSKQYTAYFLSKNSLSIEYQYYCINRAVIFTSPGTFGMLPETFGISPGIFGMLPGTFGMSPGSFGMSPGSFGMSPGTFGMSPGIFGMSPETFGMSPGTFGMSPGIFGMSPGIFGMSPGTFGMSPETIFIYPETVRINDFQVLLRNNAFGTDAGSFIFVRTLFPKRKRAFPVGRAFFGTLNKALQPGRKGFSVN